MIQIDANILARDVDIIYAILSMIDNYFDIISFLSFFHYFINK